MIWGLHVSLQGCIFRMSHCCWAPQLDDSLSKKSKKRSRTAIAANLSKFGVTTPFNCQPSISISRVWVVSLINPNFPYVISKLHSWWQCCWVKAMFPSLQTMFCSFNLSFHQHDSRWLSTSPRTPMNLHKNITKTSPKSPATDPLAYIHSSFLISRIPGQKSVAAAFVRLPP